MHSYTSAARCVCARVSIFDCQPAHHVLAYWIRTHLLSLFPCGVQRHLRASITTLGFPQTLKSSAQEELIQRQSTLVAKQAQLSAKVDATLDAYDQGAFDSDDEVRAVTPN